MFSYNPAKAAQYNFADLEKDFFLKVLPSMDERERVWSELHDFFTANAGQETIEKYRYTYWRLYVYFAWRFFNGFSPDEVIEFAAAQIPDAFRLGFDVMDIVFWYMEIKLMTEDDIVDFYIRLRRSVLASEFIAGNIKEISVTVGDLIKKVSLLQSYQDNSLEVAEFNSSIKRMLFPRGEKESIYEYITVDQDDAVMSCIDLMKLFLTMEPEDIWVAEQVYIRANAPLPEGPIISIKNVENFLAQNKKSAELEAEAEAMIKEEASAADEAPELPAVAPVSAPKPAPKAIPAPKSQVKPAPKHEVVLAEPAEPPYAVIRDKIDAAFEKDEEGNYQDLDLVMNALQKAAEKYNDPKIAELYYFDEIAGKFVWNV